MKNLKVINTEDWPRLERVIRYTGLSTHKFAQFIGLPAAENLYRIKRGQNGISRALAERIVEYFPEISKGWLMTGEGDMLRDNILNRYAGGVEFFNYAQNDKGKKLL